MRITRIESLHSKEPLTLPVPWKAAWTAPKEPPVTAFSYAFYKVYTDGGIVGIGPDTRLATPERLIGQDPFFVEALWQEEMSGRRAGNAGKGAAGIEIACWDIIGKAAGLPVYKLLATDQEPNPRVHVYASGGVNWTFYDKGDGQPYGVDALIEEALKYKSLGFDTFKWRPGTDWEEAGMTATKLGETVCRPLREAVGPEFRLGLEKRPTTPGPWSSVCRSPPSSTTSAFSFSSSR